MPFLDALARAILAGDLPAPGGVAPGPLDLPRIRLYLPTRRAARALGEAFLRIGGRRAMLLPSIRPIGEGDEAASLIHSVSHEAALPADAMPPPSIGEMERRLVLTQFVLAWSALVAAQRAGSPEEETLAAGGAPVRSPAQAAHLALELQRLMDMTETEEADLGRLAGLVPEGFSGHWQHTLEFLGILTRTWPEYLKARRMVSPATRRNLLLAAEARLAAQVDDGPVIIAGVTGSVPATARLMQAVAALPHGAIVLPGLDPELPEDAAAAVASHPSHPQFRLRKLCADIGVRPGDVAWLPGAEPGERDQHRRAIVAATMRPAGTTAAWSRLPAAIAATEARAALAGIALIAADGAEEEAEAVALILREAAEHPTTTAALVTPDRILARRVEARLLSWGIRIDDSAGRPFAKTIPGTFLDLIAEVIERRFAPPALMALLKHPLTRLGHDVGAARRRARAIELLAFRQTYFGEGLDGIARALARAEPGEEDQLGHRHPAAQRLDAADRAAAGEFLQAITAAFAPLTAISAGEHPLSDFVAAHVATAEALATDAEGSSDAIWAEEAGEVAARLLAALMDEDLPQPQVSLPHYPELYRSLIAGEAVRSRVPVHPRLSIWGPFEARLQQPDIVVLGGLNEGTWPEAADPGPWLNRPMLEALGLPSPEARTGDEAHDFASLLHAGRVYLTRAAKVDGVPTVPSRWLMRLDAVLKVLDVADALSPADGTPWLAYARHRDLIERRDGVAAPAPRPPLAARPRQLSVTRIEHWLANPYAIYAREILRLEPMPPLGGDPTMALKGEVIHEALSRFTLRHPAALPPDVAAELMAIADEVMRDLAAHPRIAAFWRPRLARFASWFAETEPGRRDGTVGIVSEIKGRLLLAPPGGPFVLTARADRIDLRADGGIVVTDYKSGQFPNLRSVVEGRSPQLPLEAAIAAAGGFPEIGPRPVAALRYVRASGGEPPGDEAIVDYADLAGLAQQALDGLLSLIATFDRPETPYRAVRRPTFADRYRFDDYAHLARVREWAAGEEGT